MIKSIIHLTLLCVILYYSFIDVMPVLYWITTGLYIFSGALTIILAYGIDTRASWIISKGITELQTKLSSTSKGIFSILNIVIITSVLIYTNNYYHLLYPLTLISLWYSIYSYSK